MAPFELEVDVPESRQVTLTLPPDVPPGRVRLTVVVEPDRPTPTSGGELPRYVVPFDPAQTEVFSGQLRVEPDGDRA